MSNNLSRIKTQHFLDKKIKNCSKKKNTKYKTNTKKSGNIVKLYKVYIKIKINAICIKIIINLILNINISF